MTTKESSTPYVYTSEGNGRSYYLYKTASGNYVFRERFHQGALDEIPEFHFVEEDASGKPYLYSNFGKG